MLFYAVGDSEFRARDEHEQDESHCGQSLQLVECRLTKEVRPQTWQCISKNLNSESESRGHLSNDGRLMYGTKQNTQQPRDSEDKHDLQQQH